MVLVLSGEAGVAAGVEGGNDGGHVRDLSHLDITGLISKCNQSWLMFRGR